MFTLSYSAAYDPYHAIFRMISVLAAAPQRKLEIHKLRVADFYICFPWLLRNLKPTTKIPQFVRKKNLLSQKYTPTTYDSVPSSSILFSRMEPFQIAAISALLANNIAEKNDVLEIALLERLPDLTLAARVDAYTAKNAELLSFVTDELAQLSYFGPGGLKDRADLGEFRYDNV